MEYIWFAQREKKQIGTQKQVFLALLFVFAGKR
jgi:hypothetical protein